jgi:aldose 1-epimerase
MISPSGAQWEISADGHRAVIVQVGGGVRAFERDGALVLDPYDVAAMCDGGHGAPLVPWANRLADGRYTWDGKTYQLALSEPAKSNASHGLLRWRPWDCLERAGDRVRVGTTLFPMPGWPFPLSVSIEYAVSASGLRVETRARNVGEVDAPFAAGQHPYLSAGGGLLDDCRLSFHAAERILVDPERSLPAGVEPVSGGEFDFSAPRRLGEQKIDHAFLGVERDGGGSAWVRLERPDGHTVALWADAAYPVLQLFTGDTLAPGRRRRGLACEPMTAPPNALASGEGIARLAPEEEWVGVWGVGLE